MTFSWRRVTQVTLLGLAPPALLLAVDAVCHLAGGGWCQWWTQAPRLLRGLAYVATGGLGAFGGAAWWMRRLRQQEDTLLEACRIMALGEPSPLADQPSNLGELGRLALAMQVVREALVEYQSLYRSFFDAAPDMFISLTPGGERIMDVNPAFCRCLGLLKDEVVERPLRRFLDLDIGWDEATRRPGELLSGRLSARGRDIKVEASLSLHQAGQGLPWFMGVILRDVTLRDSLHQELLAKSAALEQALEEIRSVEKLKDQFLTTLSHELKTPLVSLKGFMQLMMRGGASAEETASYLDVCWRNLLKLEGQINNLLDLARLSQAKDQYEMARVDLSRLARMEAENLRPTAQEQGVSLELEGISPEPAQVWGNSEKLIQLLDNLLVNAVKYNVEGGWVRVDVSRADGNVELRVADSGVGIARENMAKIFNRFYRADISGTGRLEGLGIGLSLVQEIVQLHQGDIQVDSEPGKGTTFTVILEACP